VQVWDVGGKAALTAYKHPGLVQGASWSKDDKRILSGGAGTVQVWDLTVTPWVALPPRTPEEDLTVQIEAHTGMRLDQTGRLVPLSRREWLQRKQRFEELKAQAAP
jgi:hypothetical protein